MKSRWLTQANKTHTPVNTMEIVVLLFAAIVLLLLSIAIVSNAHLAGDTCITFSCTPPVPHSGGNRMTEKQAHVFAFFFAFIAVVFPVNAFCYA